MAFLEFPFSPWFPRQATKVSWAYTDVTFFLIWVELVVMPSCQDGGLKLFSFCTIPSGSERLARELPHPLQISWLKYPTLISTKMEGRKKTNISLWSTGNLYAKLSTGGYVLARDCSASSYITVSLLRAENIFPGQQAREEPVTRQLPGWRWVDQESAHQVYSLRLTFS